MKLLIEGIERENRAEFRKRMHAISDKVSKVSFSGESASIETMDPYIVTDSSIVEKERVKKSIYREVRIFRIYQFNK